MWRRVRDNLDQFISADGFQEPAPQCGAIGAIKTAVGALTITRANVLLPTPATGDLVYEGDLIETGRDGMVVVRFVDGTTLQLHAGGHVVLDEFVYEREDRPDWRCFMFSRECLEF